MTLQFFKPECLIINLWAFRSKCDRLFAFTLSAKARFFSLSFLFFTIFRKSLCTCTQNSINRGEYQSERLGGVAREEIKRMKGIEPSVIPPSSRLPPSNGLPPLVLQTPFFGLWGVIVVCVLPARLELWESGDLDSKLKCRAGEKSSLETLTMHRVSRERSPRGSFPPCSLQQTPSP